jgi:hypothetical protein
MPLPRTQSHGLPWNAATPSSWTGPIARAHRRRWLAIAGEVDCPVIAVTMRASFALCRERNRRRQDKRRLTEERMDRMIAAFEPVQEDEGFAALFDDSTTISEILKSLQKEAIHEYCDQAR